MTVAQLTLYWIGLPNMDRLTGLSCHGWALEWYGFHHLHGTSRGLRKLLSRSSPQSPIMSKEFWQRNSNHLKRARILIYSCSELASLTRPLGPVFRFQMNSLLGQGIFNADGEYLNPPTYMTFP